MLTTASMLLLLRGLALGLLITITIIGLWGASSSNGPLTAIQENRQHNTQQQKMTLLLSPLASVKEHIMRNRSTFNSTTTSSRLRRRQGARKLQDSNTRVVGGSNVNLPGRFPYFVSLVDRSYVHQCGATLIAPDVVLTAAHCKAAILEYALVGIYDQTDPIEDYEVFEIVQEHSNPGWEWRTRIMDQMVLKLSGKSTRRPVQLNFDSTIPQSQASVTVIGLGRILDPMIPPIASSSPSHPDRLQQVLVSYLNNTECEKATDGRISYANLISADMMCVRGINQGHCQGDSGGPMLLLGDSADTDIQLGIVSWARGCGNPDFPGVAARTSATMDHIRLVTCSISEDPPEHFDCPSLVWIAPVLVPNPPINVMLPILPPDSNISMAADHFVPIAVSILFDENPEDVSWQIMALEGSGSTEVLVEVPPGTYRFEDDVIEHVMLPRGGSYIFTIRDTVGDGIHVSGIAYELTLLPGDTEEDQFVSATTTTTATSLLVEGTGTFGRERSHEFHVPAERSCSRVHSECVQHFDCCTGRCMAGVCRVHPVSSPDGTNRPSLGREQQLGGAAGSQFRPDGR